MHSWHRGQWPGQRPGRGLEKWGHRGEPEKWQEEVLEAGEPRGGTGAVARAVDRPREVDTEMGPEDLAVSEGGSWGPAGGV